MPKRTATQKHIDNINNYINKVGSFFGVNSPEYQGIVNKLKTKGITTRTNKKGFTVIANTKENRQKHQSIRAIDRNKPSFARQKKNYEKTVEALRPIEPEIETPPEPEISSPNIEDAGGGGGAPAISFEDWFNEWRQTWSETEQYEISKLAKDLDVPFDYNDWYGDYAYREQMRHALYNAWLGDIENEVNNTTSVDGYTVDTESGRMYDMSNEDIGVDIDL